EKRVGRTATIPSTHLPPATRSRRRPTRQMRGDAMHETLEAGEFVDRHRPPAPSELVVPAPLTVIARDAIGGLLDEAILDQTVDGPVEGARTHAHCAVAELCHPSHQ